MNDWALIGIGISFAVVIIILMAISYQRGWRDSARATLKYMEEIENKRNGKN